MTEEDMAAIRERAKRQYLAYSDAMDDARSQFPYVLTDALLREQAIQRGTACLGDDTATWLDVYVDAYLADYWRIFTSR